MMVPDPRLAAPVATKQIALEQSDFFVVQSLLRRTLVESPADAAALCDLGITALEEGKLQEALDWLSRAYNCNPGNEKSRQNLICLVDAINHTFLGTVLPVPLPDPEEDSLARLRVVLGEDERCLRYLHIRRILNGPDMRIPYFIALFHLAMGMPEQAEYYFLHALKFCQEKGDTSTFQSLQLMIGSKLASLQRAAFVIRNCILPMQDAEPCIANKNWTTTAQPRQSPVRIVEGFMFYNEVDTLEIKLSEHSPHVDRFVIAEGRRSFSGEPRELVFPQHKERFARYLDRISYFPVDLPVFSHPYDAESGLRNCLLSGMTDLAAEDFVIISDADEVIRSSVFTRLRADLCDPTLMFVNFRMPTFWHRLNYVCVRAPTHPQINGLAQICYPAGVRYKFLKENNPTMIRHKRNICATLEEKGVLQEGCGITVYANTGWHFSFLGNREEMVEKLRNYGHQELYDPVSLDKLDVDQMIRSRGNFLADIANSPFQGWEWSLIEIDETFPIFLQRNKHRFSKYIS